MASSSRENVLAALEIQKICCNGAIACKGNKTMRKFTIFICAAIYVQTRCFIKEYRLHNYTFHYSETHTACNGTGGCGENQQVSATLPTATPVWPVAVPTLCRPARGSGEGCRQHAELPRPLHAWQYGEGSSRKSNATVLPL